MEKNPERALEQHVFAYSILFFLLVCLFVLFFFDNPIYKTYVALIPGGKIISRSRHPNI